MEPAVFPSLAYIFFCSDPSRFRFVKEAEEERKRKSNNLVENVYFVSDETSQNA